MYSWIPCYSIRWIFYIVGSVLYENICNKVSCRVFSRYFSRFPAFFSKILLPYYGRTFWCPHSRRSLRTSGREVKDQKLYGPCKIYVYHILWLLSGDCRFEGRFTLHFEQENKICYILVSQRGQFNHRGLRTKSVCEKSLCVYIWRSLTRVSTRIDTFTHQNGFRGRKVRFRKGAPIN